MGIGSSTSHTFCFPRVFQWFVKFVITSFQRTVKSCCSSVFDLNAKPPQHLKPSFFGPQPRLRRDGWELHSSNPLQGPPMSKMNLSYKIGKQLDVYGNSNIRVEISSFYEKIVVCDHGI